VIALAKKFIYTTRVIICDYLERDMGRLLILLGIVAVIAAIVYMFVMLGGIENETTESIMEGLICEANERLSRTVENDSSGNSVNFYCTDFEGIERNVNLGAIAIIGGGFTALLLLGILSIRMGAKKIAQQLTGQFQNFTMQAGQSNGLDMRDGSYQSGEIPPETMEKLQQVMGQIGTLFAANKETLTERLQELEEARNKGLITDSEYSRVRQAILDSMDD
jgi:hypothetical protein